MRLITRLKKIIIALVPFRSKRHLLRKKLMRNEKKFELTKLHFKFNDNINKLKSSKNKLRVCFAVMYDVFVTKELYLAMLDDDFFDPIILVIPDTMRGQENMFYQMKKTYEKLSIFGNVFMSYDFCDGKFVDYTSKYDLFCTTNPYDHMTHKFYTVEYQAVNGKLPFFISYGYMPDLYAVKYIFTQKALDYCWKIFVDTKENLEDYKKYSIMNGENAVLSGYCKMDAIANINKQERKRKKIILAPHHTVGEEFASTFPLSNFLEYSDLFLELPTIFKEVDFVFRPHPLLFIRLKKEDMWGEKKVNQYLDKITSFENVEYQEGGDYFDTFVNSDGIIHDCSSFLVEYLFTNNSACYILRNKNSIDEIFNQLGKNCLKHYYLAYAEDDVINYIQRVVVGKDDSLKYDRTNFVKRYLKINYPHVSKKITDHIKGCFV